MTQELGNLWNDLLSESFKRIKIPNSTLVILGDANCGKSQILRCMGNMHSQQSNELSELKGALSFSYLDVADPNQKAIEPDARLNIWSINHPEFENLLYATLQTEQLSQTLFVVAFDLSTPWNIMETLQKWSKVLESLSKRLLERVSPEEKKKLLDRAKQLIFSTPNRNSEEEKDELKAIDAYEERLEDGFLQYNLGIPLIVLGCKSDCIQYETFDDTMRQQFIQYKVQNFCMKYGASLIYTSATDNIKMNCDLFYRYLLSLLYNKQYRIFFDQNTKEKVHEIFYPAFTNRKQFIDGLILQSNPWNAETKFNEFIRKPDNYADEESTQMIDESDLSETEESKNPSQKTEIELDIEEEQVWLNELKSRLDERKNKKIQSDSVEAQNTGVNATNDGSNTNESGGNEVQRQSVTAFYQNLLSQTPHKTKVSEKKKK